MCNDPKVWYKKFILRNGLFMNKLFYVRRRCTVFLDAAKSIDLGILGTLGKLIFEIVCTRKCHCTAYAYTIHIDEPRENILNQLA